MDKVIEIKGINFSYGAVKVLEDINLNINKSDFLGIIGPNGGGKTTLLKIMLGLLKPDSGKVKIFGQDIDRDSVKRIGYVPQTAYFEPHFPITVYDIVLSGRIGKKGLFGNYNVEDKKRAKELLEKLEVEKYRENCLCELSGGEIQRVLIARALAGDPEILLLDEPTSGIDAKAEKNFHDLLSKLNENIPIVIISHDIGVISRYVNKIACLNKKLHYHDSKELTSEMIENAYHCPVDLIAHGAAHRVLPPHSKGDSDKK